MAAQTGNAYFWNYDIDNLKSQSQFQRYAYKYFPFGLPYSYFRLSVADAIIWGTFYKLGMVENPKIAVRISTPSIVVSEM